MKIKDPSFSNAQSYYRAFPQRACPDDFSISEICSAILARKSTAFLERQLPEIEKTFSRFHLKRVIVGVVRFITIINTDFIYEKR